MPIYEFHCKECASDFKTLRKAEKLAEIAGPDCGTEKVMRIISVTAKTGGPLYAEESACSLPMEGGGCARPGGCGCM